MDLDKWLEQVSKCSTLEENDMKLLCDKVEEILVEEENVLELSAPISVCGDVHGQFYDLIELWKAGGELPATKYLFLGDYVDRGYYSLETLTWLLLLKARHPDRIFLIRGNHESRDVSRVYGFWEEIQQKYGNSSIWLRCVEVFDAIPIAALIDNKIMCVHGGLSPEFPCIDDIRTTYRLQEIPRSGGMSDLMWSDPEDHGSGWKLNNRGAGWIFGSDCLKEFHHRNGTQLLARAHQLAQEGYKFQLNDQLITVWSAPNYCYRCGNLAAVMKLDESLKPEFEVFDAMPNEKRVIPEKTRLPYFL